MSLTGLLSPLQFLVFGSFTLVLLLSLGTYLFVRAFRREPAGILRRSFLDATGQPNGVLLTVFNAVVMINALTITGAWSGRWPPVYVWATWGAIVLSGVVADTAVTRAQISASVTGPDESGTSGPASQPGFYSAVPVAADSSATSASDANPESYPSQP